MRGFIVNEDHVAFAVGKLRREPSAIADTKDRPWTSFDPLVAPRHRDISREDDPLRMKGRCRWHRRDRGRCHAVTIAGQGPASGAGKASVAPSDAGTSNSVPHAEQPPRTRPCETVSCHSWPCSTGTHEPSTSMLPT